MRLEIAQLKEEVRSLKNSVNVLLNCPHTIWTVSDVLNLCLSPEQRKLAGLLAYRIFKAVHPEVEPENIPIYDMPVKRYTAEDVWIVRIAVQRIAEGGSCAPPSEDVLGRDVWLQCLKEADIDSS